MQPFLAWLANYPEPGALVIVQRVEPSYIYIYTSVTRAQAHTVPGEACGLPCILFPGRCVSGAFDTCFGKFEMRLSCVWGGMRKEAADHGVNSRGDHGGWVGWPAGELIPSELYHQGGMRTVTLYIGPHI